MIRTFFALLVASLFTSTTCFAFAQNANKPASPAGMASAPKQEGTPHAGKVIQSMNSGGYTYVLLQKGGGEQVWLAMLRLRFSKGSR